VALLGGAFLLGPMYALTYVRVQKYQLMTAVLFVLSFAILVALGSKASNQELLGATAAYSAVLVIFINQNSAPTTPGA
jgi:Na+(H+)/acetate symporter ActP